MYNCAQEKQTHLFLLAEARLGLEAGAGSPFFSAWDQAMLISHQPLPECCASPACIRGWWLSGGSSPGCGWGTGPGWWRWTAGSCRSGKPSALCLHLDRVLASSSVDCAFSAMLNFDTWIGFWTDTMGTLKHIIWVLLPGTSKCIDINHRVITSWPEICICWQSSREHRD